MGNQRTPIHYACMRNSDLAIRLLERFPDEINFVDQDGWHALHHACQHGHLELVKYIFRNQDFDIDFNVATFESGMTPFHFACYAGELKVAKFLLMNSKEKIIDIWRKTNDQRTAVDLAR